MGKSLLVYTGKSFKEYILPSINDSDYELVLNKNFFHIANDITLQMEVIENEWKFSTSNFYRVYISLGEKQSERAENKPICAGNILKVISRSKEEFSIIVTELEHAFTPYRKYQLNPQQKITIGRSQENVIQYEFLKLVSKSHAVIQKENSAWTIEDMNTPNGVYINGQRIVGKYMLKYGDYINIVGIHLVFMGNVIAIDADREGVHINEDVLKEWGGLSGEETVMLAPSHGKKIFHRSPRSVLSIETNPIVIEAPPAPEKPEDMPLLMTLGPSLTMAFPMLLSCAMMMIASRSSGSSRGIMMYTGLIMALSSAVIGIYWNLKNQSFHKKQLKEKEIHRFEAYSQYLVKKTNEVKEKYEHNVQALQERYISAEQCVSYNSKNKDLWSRNSLHSDFLSHRIGIGDIPFQAPIQVPEEKFSLLDDNLTEKPHYIYENYKTLFKIPVTLDLLKHNLIGVVGGTNKKGALQLARILTAQIAANNCYTDVKLAYVYNQNNSDDVGEWDYARWLPHVWTEDRKFRFVASEKNEAGDVFFMIANIMRQREELASQSSSNKVSLYKPHIVLFVSSPELLEGELLAKYIFDAKYNYGLTTILLVEDKQQLPNSCRFIIEKSEEFSGLYDTMAGVNDRFELTFDDVSEKSLEKFARELSDIEVMEVEEGGEIPTSMTFFEMYHVNKLEEFNVIERWKKNRTYDNIKGLLGQKSGGKECYLDVHEKYHGPHGLVAGTTGSGKSETLQTYLLSLAINYSPNDIGFFIIDYKGGGMANLFEGLPHLIGSISNLSGNQVHRAMVSIKSENRRRQRIFNENGVNNINLYTKLYKNGEATLPVPHLFIVIDEFAELKREEPDFMRELISVAQVGRSLGVHLILATQKPSGTVDDNIWSNSKFRLCLRVQDRQDSNDMLHKPDAAYITQSGRCYLQVGNDEVFELFQSGYSGAVYVEDDNVSKTDLAALLSVTGREEIKGSYAKNLQKAQLLKNWVITLEKAYLGSVNKNPDKEHTSFAVIKGMYRELSELGIEYPESDYNSKRLEEFIRVYDKTAEMDGDRISNVIQVSVRNKVKLPQQKDKTQLDAVKEYLAEVAAKNGYHYDLQLWMPVLPQYLYLDEFEEYKKAVCSDGNWKNQSEDWEMKVLIGKVDDPNNQAQMPHYIDISREGHMAVCGSVTSGKSTFLQTLVYSMIHTYSPQYVNIYAIDFSSKMMSAFEHTPHFGGVMYEDDFEKIAKLFNMVAQILKERKLLFHGGNYSQYVKVNGITLPAIFIIIDNFSAFNEKTEEKYLDFLIQLSKEGVNHGIFLIIAAAGIGRTEIPARLAENIMNIVALQQADKFGYGDLLNTMQFDVIPETGVKGRGLVLYHGVPLEFQAALSIKATDDYQRMELIQAECQKLSEMWDGKAAKPIPVIPEKPLWAEYEKLDEVEAYMEQPERIPVGYDAETAGIYALNLRNLYCYLVMGEARTGKKNFLKVFIESISRKGESRICIIDSASKLLRTYEERANIDYVNTDEQIFEYFKELTPVFQARNRKKHELEDKGYEEDEIFDVQIKEIPYFIFITDFAWFIELIQNSEYEMEGFLNTIFAKGRIHHIYFIANLEQENYRGISGTALFHTFSSYRTGILFGGNASENAVFNFDYLSYREQSQIYKAGIGRLPGPLMEGEPQKIVVPLVKGKKND